MGFPHESIKRVIEKDLAPLSGNVKITRTEREIELKASPTYGLETKYLRTVHYARLRTAAPAPQLQEVGITAGRDLPKHAFYMIRSNNSGATIQQCCILGLRKRCLICTALPMGRCY